MRKRRRVEIPMWTTLQEKENPVTSSELWATIWTALPENLQTLVDTKLMLIKSIRHDNK